MAYLGLYAGMTISASIPAAIMSMGILKLFRESNILENNIVQTAASAGESLAAGVIFTIPALLLIGYWDTIDYWEVTKIANVIHIRKKFTRMDQLMEILHSARQLVGLSHQLA